MTNSIPLPGKSVIINKGDDIPTWLIKTENMEHFRAAAHLLVTNNDGTFEIRELFPSLSSTSMMEGKAVTGKKCVVTGQGKGVMYISNHHAGLVKAYHGGRDTTHLFLTDEPIEGRPN